MSRVEVVTTGIDEAVQLIGSDPFGRNASLGLRIPSLVLNNATPEVSRYLFMLCSFSVPNSGPMHIRGIRQYVSMGFTPTGEGATYRPVEQQIKNPQWHPPGGNISWHLMDLGPPNGTGIATPSAGLFAGVDNFASQMSYSPALLYGDVGEAAVILPTPYYVGLTAYLPPNGGQPYGTPLMEGGWSTMFDLRTEWRDDHAWESLDIKLCGPRTVALFASVRQSDPSVPHYALPQPASQYGNGLSEEEQFLVNFPGAQYWRIAGSLIVDA
jgi:hypothetical protein